ncbi:hypothetical protein F0U44_16030 [Nocardioides humilatus]|uniref:Uncharacterized protein n=1 Tax=Nocardioides humilatus TaxID=2607660 RepID=A0A5B1LBY7_9ACTN|nr:DUF5994 family protein [Nocardioides humilatus]KAA1417794.1 hypothetical protein F0U44_16030 [Nocardioides humilatus]
MGAPSSVYPFRAPAPLGALRLDLAPTFGHAAVDGRWRPYGRDLAREAAHLVDDFPIDRGRIDRIAYVRDDWDAGVTEVYTRRGKVKIGLLPDDHPAGLVLLRLVGVGIVRVRVDWIAPTALLRVYNSDAPAR